MSQVFGADECTCFCHQHEEWNDLPIAAHLNACCSICNYCKKKIRVDAFANHVSACIQDQYSFDFDLMPDHPHNQVAAGARGLHYDPDCEMYCDPEGKPIRDKRGRRIE